jgi:outer membrane protein assembly factor BamA
LKNCYYLFASFTALLIISIPVLFPVFAPCAETQLEPQKIVSVSFIGNKTTRAKILHMFLQSYELDSGDIYDSVKINFAKQKLLATNLFSKVDIFPVQEKSGIHLFVILREVFYLIPDGVGGERYERKYGNEDVWYRVRLGLTRYNFLGKMETFSIGVSAWDERSLSLSWTKPLYPSPYYIGISSGTSYAPDLNFPQNRFSVNGKITLGRKLTMHSRGFIGLVPVYTRIDDLNGSVIQKFREIVSSVGGGIDFRNDSYDPLKGWLLYEEFRNNVLYSDFAPKYGQFFTEIRLYIPAFFTRDRFALRLQSTLRTNDAGNYKRLYLGGESSVRGFPSGWLGLTDTMNNYAAISAEYRFFILRSPTFNFSFLTDRLPELPSLFYELEGALIFDAGHLWHEFLRPLDRRQNGAGIGVGIRIRAPSFRTTGCIDVVWPITREIDEERSEFNHTVIYACPSVHIYLSIF